MIEVKEQPLNEDLKRQIYAGFDWYISSLATLLLIIVSTNSD